VLRKLSGSTYTAYLPGHKANMDCTMGSSAQSASVAMLQRSLNICYSDDLDFNLKVDGVFGKDSRTHLKWEFTRGTTTRCARI
jgi:hypothetical protein